MPRARGQEVQPHPRGDRAPHSFLEPVTAGRASHAEAVLPPRLFETARLLRVLGWQYVGGGTLAATWAAVPAVRPAAGAGVVLGLAAVAVATGVALQLPPLLRRPESTLSPLVHLCLGLAHVLVLSGYLVVGRPWSPLLFFLLWTTPYAGVWSDWRRWAHLATASALSVAAGVLGVSLRHMPLPETAVAVVAQIAAMLVVTLLVARTTDTLRRMALLDLLTGLPNRRALAARVSARAAACTTAADAGLLTRARRRAPLPLRASKAMSGEDGPGRGHGVLLVCGVDRFKRINDSFGHATGDQLLLALAHRIEQQLLPGEFLARLGGDEFAVFAESTDPHQVTTMRERLAEAWSHPFPADGQLVHLTATVGAAVLSESRDRRQLIRDATAAMHHAKAVRSTGVIVFDESLRATAERLVVMESELRQALQRGELSVHYQPVVALEQSQDKCVLGAEALLRWHNERLGRVGPDEFIPLAEATGMIESLGRWVLERAATDLAAWRSDGLVPVDFHVAVNVSTHQIDDSLPDLVARVMDQHGLPEGSIALEVTESALTRDAAVAQRVLRQLRTQGVPLFLDDFGTGQSSLARLHRFSFDVVKVDRSFVAGMGEREVDRMIVAGIVSLAHSLNLRVVAEGVERAETALELQDLGCDAGQGWLYAKPVPAGALPQLVADLDHLLAAHLPVSTSP